MPALTTCLARDGVEALGSRTSVVINSAALGSRSRGQLSSSGIPHGRRGVLLKEQILPGLIGRQGLEVVVAGEYEPGEGFLYVSSPSVAFDCTDALQQRAAGLSASSGNIVLFQHDDHIVCDGFFQILSDKYAQDDSWDVLVPSRWAMDGGKRRRLNDGRADGYVMGHACVMRRAMAECVPWSSVPRVFTWDVEHTRLLRGRHARLLWVEDLKVWDLEGRAPGYAW